MERALASERTVMTADEFLNLYYSTKPATLPTEEVEKPRRFVEIPKRTKKLVRYDREFHYNEPAPVVYPKKKANSNAITHYAIIDHVGSLNEQQMRNTYNKVYSQAKKDNFEKDKNLFTMKKFCEKNYNPYTRKRLEGVRLQNMKFAMRHQKNPSEVYFVCPTLYKSTEREVRKWAERGIKVHIYEANPSAEWTMPLQKPLVVPAEYYSEKDPVAKQKLFDPSANVKKGATLKMHAPADYIYDHAMMSASTDIEYEDFEATHEYAWDSSANKIRRLVDMLAPAFGIRLSAPAIRFDRERVPENYIKRSDFERMSQSGETHFTKPLTSSTKFLTHHRCVATEAEIKNAWVQIAGYLSVAGCTVCMEIGNNFGSISGDIVTLKREYLDIDYMICEECGRPMKVHQGENECPHCGAIYEEEIAYSVFYDDAYFEDCEYYTIDSVEDTEYTEDQYWKDLESEFDF